MSRFLDCLHTGKASVRPGIRSADTKQREGKGKEKKKEGNAYYAHTCFATRWKSPPSSRSYFLISYFHGMRRVPACHPRSLHVFAVHVPPDGKNRASLRYATMEGNTGAQGEGIRINVSKIHFGEIRKFYIYIYIYRWDLTASFARNFVFFFLASCRPLNEIKLNLFPEKNLFFSKKFLFDPSWMELSRICVG